MTILTEQVEQVQFEEFAAVKTWAEKSSKQLIRIPIQEFISNNSFFSDDEYYGDGDYWVRFNENGLKNFCSILGFRIEMLRMIESPNLSSQVLNDLIFQHQAKEKFKGFDFVIDDEKKIIIGIVSESYVGYSNHTFLKDINELFIRNNLSEKLIFKKAYNVNSELTIIFNSTSLHGEINGRGGKGIDKSEIGIAFKNSMVGTSSVNINYHIFRLACANGLMVPTSESVKRIYHSGNISNFQMNKH